MRERLAEIPDESIHCCITSPPYFGLRDYGMLEQIGLEASPTEYIETLVSVFREVHRVLRKDGTLWLNIGDSYAAVNRGENARPRSETLVGIQCNNPHSDIRTRSAVIHNQKRQKIKPKDLLGIPWTLALALRDDGWYLRSEVTWCKISCMPESVNDRPTSATEKIFLMTKSSKYFYDGEAVKEPFETDPKENYPNRAGILGRGINLSSQAPLGANRRDSTGGYPPNGNGRNLRNFWLLGPEPFPDAHFACFPSEIPRRGILAGTSERGVCPKCGAPWERQIKKTPFTDRPNSGAIRGNSPSLRVLCNPQRGNQYLATETVDWRATCEHSAPAPISATVLDPFFGAGTTGLVADQLGRNCIGIELNPTYAEMARKRILQDAGMFANVNLS